MRPTEKTESIQAPARRSSYRRLCPPLFLQRCPWQEESCGPMLELSVHLEWQYPVCWLVIERQNENYAMKKDGGARPKSTGGSKRACSGVSLLITYCESSEGLRRSRYFRDLAQSLTGPMLGLNLQRIEEPKVYLFLAACGGWYLTPQC